MLLNFSDRIWFAQLDKTNEKTTERSGKEPVHLRDQDVEPDLPVFPDPVDSRTFFRIAAHRSGFR